jgi:hypothetical protein
MSPAAASGHDPGDHEGAEILHLPGGSGPAPRSETALPDVRTFMPSLGRGYKWVLGVFGVGIAFAMRRKR